MTLAPQQRARLRRALLRWFDREARALPWRATRDPYRIWLSEIMLQQTRVDQAMPYYARFLEAFPDAAALAAASEDRVLKLWEGLGYYSRARNLHRAARVIVHDRGGVFPEDAAGWRGLPGIGPYTAGAIASIAFGERVPAVDGNVKRVLARLFDIAAPVGGAAAACQLWAIAGELVPPRRPGAFNQALMELGARICLPRRPRCPACPVRRDCQARAAGLVRHRPVRPAAAPPPRRCAAAAVITHRNGRLLLAKRRPGGLLGGLWEFPTFPVPARGMPGDAVAAAVHAHLGLDVEVGENLGVVEHAYSHFRQTLQAFACRHQAGRPAPGPYAEVKWIRRAELDRYPLPGSNHKLLRLLAW